MYLPVKAQPTEMCQKHTSGSHPTLQRKSWASETVVEEEGEEGRAGSKETGDGVNFILLLFCGQEVGEVWRSIVVSAPFIRPPPPSPLSLARFSPSFQSGCIFRRGIMVPGMVIFDMLA